MTNQKKTELENYAQEINQMYDAEEIDYLVALVRQKRLDEIRKSKPYGSYASAKKRCPYCGK